MRLEWVKDRDNVAYVDAADFFDNFSKEAGVPDLREQVEAFAAAPVKEGITIKGTKRTSLRVFIPNLYFGEEREMGENPWVYLGDFYPAYCIYNL